MIGPFEKSAFHHGRLWKDDGRARGGADSGETAKRTEADLHDGRSFPPQNSGSVWPGRTARDRLSNLGEKGADRMIRAFPFLSQPISALTLPQAERLAEPPKIQRRAAPLELRGRARNALLLLRWL